MLSCSLNKIESTPVCRSTEPQDILPEQKRWEVKRAQTDYNQLKLDFFGEVAMA